MTGGEFDLDADPLGHILQVTIPQGTSLTDDAPATVVCPYHPDDLTRPCWPVVTCAYCDAEDGSSGSGCAACSGATVVAVNGPAGCVVREWIAAMPAEMQADGDIVLTAAVDAWQPEPGQSRWVIGPRRTRPPEFDAVIEMPTEGDDTA